VILYLAEYWDGEIVEPSVGVIGVYSTLGKARAGVQRYFIERGSSLDVGIISRTELDSDENKEVERLYADNHDGSLR